jgi:uncharacterized alpha-E superfamily protein
LHFIRIGTFLERADNTARLLDVKYHALTGMAGGEFFGPGAGANPAVISATGQVQSAGQSQGSGLASSASAAGATPSASPGSAQEVDFYHWSAILRSVSGFEIYRKVYRNVTRPERVAELLILRPDMPRSLAASMNEVVANLQLVANQQSAETLRRAGRLKSDLQYGRIDEILATGLHAYLTQFLDRVNDLGVGISRDFLVPMAT